MSITYFFVDYSTNLLNKKVRKRRGRGKRGDMFYRKIIGFTGVFSAVDR